MYFLKISSHFTYWADKKSSPEDIEVSSPIPSTDHDWDGSKWVVNPERRLASIRNRRNALLYFTDKYMIQDFPITDEERNKWKIYRQELRNFPQTVDLENPVWPFSPKEII